MLSSKIQNLSTFYKKGSKNKYLILFYFRLSVIDQDMTIWRHISVSQAGKFKQNTCIVVLNGRRAVYLCAHFHANERRSSLCQKGLRVLKRGVNLRRVGFGSQVSRFRASMPALTLGNNRLSALLIILLLLYIYFLLQRLESYFPCNFWFVISITFVSRRIMERPYLSLRPHYFRLRKYASDFD